MAISKAYNGTWAWMNSQRAKQLGIKNGDTITLASDLAQKQVQVKVTELLHPDCIWIPSAYGGFSPKAEVAYGVGVNYNDFLPMQVEPIAGSVMGQEVIVTVRKGVN